MFCGFASWVGLVLRGGLWHVCGCGCFDLFVFGLLLVLFVLLNALLVFGY